MEPSFRRLRDETAPKKGEKDRIRARMEARITPALFAEVRKLTAPPAESQSTIFDRILDGIEPRAVRSLLDQLRAALSSTGSARTQIWQSMVPRLAPSTVTVLSQRSFKWVAALLVVIVALRASPLLFIAPASRADSSALAIPTSGTLSVSLGGLWEPVTHELSLKQGAQFRADKGEATFILNDDGNVRVRDALITIHDVTNRPEAAPPGPTISLVHGSLWVQGFVPEEIRGIGIAVSGGNVIVHEGSVSITAGETVQVRVWDRHALITRPGARDLLLVAGERVDISQGGVSVVKKISGREYDEKWAAQNLAKDAVHRLELAQLQRERYAARAGILPTSPLYVVKRAAEAVDVMLTIDPQQKVEKQLQQASTRLNEAGALLASGGTGATADAALAEYRSAMLSVASGSGQNSVTQFLLRQQIAEDTENASAATSNDSVYAVKKAVLQASADVPDTGLDQKTVEGVLFLDSLDTLSVALKAGDAVGAKIALSDAELYLTALKDDTDALEPEVKKEALALLSSMADALGGQEEGTFEQREIFLQEVTSYLPAEEPVQAVMSDMEAEQIVGKIYARVFVFKQPRSRWSQLMYEIGQLHGHPDEGKILRHLYKIMPENGLAGPVRTAIVELAREKAAR